MNLGPMLLSVHYNDDVIIMLFRGLTFALHDWLMIQGVIGSNKYRVSDR